MNFKWTQVFKSLIIVFLALSVLILLTPFLLPLALGGILCVVIFPMYKKMVEKKWNPSLAALTSLLVFSLVFAVPTTLVVLKGARVTTEFVQKTLDSKKPTQDLKPEEQKNIQKIENFAEKTAGRFGIDIPDPSAVFDKIYNSIGAFILAALTDFFTKLPDFVLAFFIALLTMYFGLVENEKIYATLKKYSFLSPKNAEKLVENIVVSCRSVIVSNVVTGAIQSIVVAAGAHLTNTGNFFVVGFITFVFSFIPVVGAAPVAYALGAYALVSGESTAGIIMMVVGTVAGISDNFIRPMMLSGSGEVHPLWSLLGILGGIIIFGLPGLFIGPLILAVASSCLPIYVKDFRETSKQLNGQS
ncbi:MAG: AI-2E family transporter [Bdellovibrionota bacterium]